MSGKTSTQAALHISSLLEPHCAGEDTLHNSYFSTGTEQGAKDDSRFRNGSPILPPWTKFTSFIHNCIIRGVILLSTHAAKNPKAYIIYITILSFTLLPVGFFTNFRMEVEQEAILAPYSSLSRDSYNWIDQESGFPESTRPFDLLIHEKGANVLTISAMRKVFEALEWFEETPKYDEICATGDYENFNDQMTCRVNSATRFWYHNVSYFEQNVTSDQEMRKILSADQYPGGTPVGDHDFILGNFVRDPTNNGTLKSAQSYLVRIDVPVTQGTSDFEDAVTARLLDLREKWKEEQDNPVRLEFFTFRSIPNEFTRAIKLDLPLYPAVFVIMCGFICVVLFRRDRVQSRCLLGIGSVITIAFSLMTGNGLMWILGVPLTNLTMSLAFVVFGVGLDDTFIIMGQYSRTDPRKDVVQRVEETMEVIGLSIFVTTLTTMVAFGLGSMSPVPAIRWLCFYALPIIFIDFIFQITFFIALLVLDERRIKARRRDCSFCISISKEEPDKDINLANEEGQSELDIEVDYCYPDGNGHTASQQDTGAAARKNPNQDHSRTSTNVANCPADIKALPKTYAERFMSCYAVLLMKPTVKVLVIIGFIGYLGAAMYSATLLREEFRPEDIVPKDSYVKGFLNGVNKYSVQIIKIGAYFRDIDQSDIDVQEQMDSYLTELSGIKAIDEEPPFCWFRDFRKFEEENQDMVASVGNLTFAQKMKFALSIPAIREVYGGDIVMDENDTITASRCWLFMKHLDMEDVQAQTDMLLEQRKITYHQPINEGRRRPAFFSFDIWYIIWEFYRVATKQLILNTIASIVAVSIVGFLFIPHWTAVLFISPLITTLYIDLLGSLQFAGDNINVVTYVCLVISVGLLVDFLMHILLRYYESHGRTREEKIKDTLECMGPSILMGGLSTFLGVLPLAFSTNEVTRVVFHSFFAMVTLGIGHGLVFLPVVLSLVGPTDTLAGFPRQQSKGAEDKLTEQNESSRPASPVGESGSEVGGFMSTKENSEHSSSSTSDDKAESSMEVETEPDV